MILPSPPNMTSTLPLLWVAYILFTWNWVYVINGWQGPGHSWWRISNTGRITQKRSGIKCKYIFMLPQNYSSHHLCDTRGSEMQRSYAHMANLWSICYALSCPHLLDNYGLSLPNGRMHYEHIFFIAICQHWNYIKGCTHVAVEYTRNLFDLKGIRPCYGQCKRDLKAC